MEFYRCTKGDIVVCPPNKAICGMQRQTCEISLYFQTFTLPPLQEIVLTPAPSPNKYYSTNHCGSIIFQRNSTELLTGSGFLMNVYLPRLYKRHRYFQCCEDPNARIWIYQNFTYRVKLPSSPNTKHSNWMT
jgi:hypothetical protein